MATLEDIFSKSENQLDIEISKLNPYSINKMKNIGFLIIYIELLKHSNMLSYDDKRLVDDKIFHSYMYSNYNKSFSEIYTDLNTIKSSKFFTKCKRNMTENFEPIDPFDTKKISSNNIYLNNDVCYNKVNYYKYISFMKKDPISNSSISDIEIEKIYKTFTKLQKLLLEENNNTVFNNNYIINYSNELDEISLNTIFTVKIEDILEEIETFSYENDSIKSYVENRIFFNKYIILIKNYILNNKIKYEDANILNDPYLISFILNLFIYQDKSIDEIKNILIDLRDSEIYSECPMNQFENFKPIDPITLEQIEKDKISKVNGRCYNKVDIIKSLQLKMEDPTTREILNQEIYDTLYNSLNKADRYLIDKFKYLSEDEKLEDIQELINRANTRLSELAYESSGLLLMLIGWVYLSSMPPKNIILDIYLSPIIILIFINLLKTRSIKKDIKRDIVNIENEILEMDLENYTLENENIQLNMYEIFNLYFHGIKYKYKLVKTENDF